MTEEHKKKLSLNLKRDTPYDPFNVTDVENKLKNEDTFLKTFNYKEGKPSGFHTQFKKGGNPAMMVLYSHSRHNHPGRNSRGDLELKFPNGMDSSPLNCIIPTLKRCMQFVACTHEFNEELREVSNFYFILFK